MTRDVAIREVLAQLGNAAVLGATGMISREMFSAQDRANFFYTIGSMGLVASIGLGVALRQPQRRVVVFDGDGSVLMAMGTLAMIAERRPENYVQVVFDNETYASTGGQRSISDTIALDQVAAATGFSWTARAKNLEQLRVLAPRVARDAGPGFLLVKVEPGNVDGIGRVSLSPERIAERFRGAFRA